MRITANTRLTFNTLAPAVLMACVFGLLALRGLVGEAEARQNFELHTDATRTALQISAWLGAVQREAQTAVRNASEMAHPEVSEQNTNGLRNQLSSAEALSGIALALPPDAAGERKIIEVTREADGRPVEINIRNQASNQPAPDWLMAPATGIWLPVGNPFELATQSAMVSVAQSFTTPQGMVTACASVSAITLSNLFAQSKPMEMHWLLLNESGEVMAADERRHLGRPYTDWGPAGSDRGSFAARALRELQPTVSSVLLAELGPVQATWAALPLNGWRLLYLQKLPPIRWMSLATLRQASLALVCSLALLLASWVVARRNQRRLASAAESALAVAGTDAVAIHCNPADALGIIEGSLASIEALAASSSRVDREAAALQLVRLRVLQSCAQTRLALAQVLEQVGAALPAAFDQSSKLAVRIEVGSQRYESPGFAETSRGLFAPIQVDNSTVGSVWVFLASKAVATTSAQQALINECAQVLGDVLLRERERQLVESQKAQLLQNMESRAGALQKTERLLRDITNSMPGALFQMVRGADGEISLSFVSAGVEAVFGVNREQVLASMGVLAERIYPEDFASLLAVMRAAGDGDELAMSFRITHGAKGELRWVRAAANVLAEEGGNVVINGTWLDITTQKTLELALESARAEADQANESKSRFLANMSHEIRTPMNAIIGLTHLAHAQSTQPKVREQLQKVEDAAHTLLSLLNDILDFSKIEAGRLSLEKVVFDLRQVLQRVEGLMSERARGKSLKFEVQVAPEIPNLLMGDPLRLSQVLLNLVSNAVKFTEQGEVRVTVEMVHASPLRSRLRFTVIDTGPGMDDLQISRLFSAFQQADSSTTRRYGGTGLGLTISKQLVALMGGDLTMRSTKGRGSSFRFTVELDVAEVGDALTDTVPSEQILRSYSSAPVSVAASLASLSGARVLVVDDNAINLEIAAELLKAVGVQVTVATSGAAALEWLAAHEADAVLMDVQMPQMDGYTATAHIRNMPQWRALPVIAMTANAMSGDREKCLAAGMNDHIPKPINPEELRQTLGRWLHESARLRGGELADSP